VEEILRVISFIIRYYNARFSWVYGINYYGVPVHRFDAKNFYTVCISMVSYNMPMVSYNMPKNSNNK